MLPELPYVSTTEGQRLADKYMADAANGRASPDPPQRTPDEPDEPVLLSKRILPPLHISDVLRFGVTRVYQGCPSYVPPPDRETKLRYKAFSPLDLVQEVKDFETIIQPWPNWSSWLWDYHSYMHGALSQARSDAGVRVMQYQGTEDKYMFKPGDLNIQKSAAARAQLKNTGAPPWVEKPAEWKEKAVTITMPTQGVLTNVERTKLSTLFARVHKADVSSRTADDAPTPPDTGLNVDIPGFWYRPLTKVIEHVWSHDPTRRHFHVQPYHEYVTKSRLVAAVEDPLLTTTPATPGPSSLPSAPPTPSVSASASAAPASLPHPRTDSSAFVPPSYATDPESFERVYGELYTADQYHEVCNDLQDFRWKMKQPMSHKLRHEIHEVTVAATMLQACPYEWVVASLMVSSDATVPYTFSNLKLWPIYLYFGCMSKYFRGQPSSNSAHHVGYMPSVRCSL
jgi:hypothetical protein